MNKSIFWLLIVAIALLSADILQRASKPCPTVETVTVPMSFEDSMQIDTMHSEIKDTL